MLWNVNDYRLKCNTLISLCRAVAAGNLVQKPIVTKFLEWFSAVTEKFKKDSITQFFYKKIWKFHKFPAKINLKNVLKNNQFVNLKIKCFSRTSGIFMKLLFQCSKKQLKWCPSSNEDWSLNNNNIINENPYMWSSFQTLNHDVLWSETLLKLLILGTLHFEQNKSPYTCQPLHFFLSSLFQESNNLFQIPDFWD